MQPIVACSEILPNEAPFGRRRTALFPWEGLCQVSPTRFVPKPMGSGLLARGALGTAPRPGVRRCPNNRLHSPFGDGKWRVFRGPHAVPAGLS